MATRRMWAQHEQVIATVVGLVAPSTPELDDDARAAALRDVNAFVASQVQSLPSFMRLPYKILLTGFDWLPLLRYGHRFRYLGRDAQERYLSRWASGSLGVMRAFVKLMRSCALLAYFDHPLVREQLEAGRDESARRAGAGL